MANRPHISDLFTPASVIKVVLVPAIVATLFLVLPVPEEIVIMILIALAAYLYGVVRDKIVISDYDPTSADSEGEELTEIDEERATIRSK